MLKSGKFSGERSLDPGARALRGRFFAHMLADLACCEHKGTPLARWFEQLCNELPGTQRDQQWREFLLGRFPRGPLRDALLDHFEELGEVPGNLLWLSLVVDPDGKIDWDTLACSEPVNLFTSPGRRGELLAFSCPDWKRLGALLILLRTRSTRFSLHRRWAAKSILPYLQIACISPPLSYIGLVLFRRILEIYGTGQFGQLYLSHWPANEREFRHNVRLYRLIAGRAVQRGWVSELMPGGRLLLMILLTQPRELSVEALYALSKHRGDPRCPRNLRRQLDRARRAYVAN